MPCIPPVRYTRKVYLFPHTLDWKGMLAGMIENPHVKSIAMVAEFDDGRCIATWSHQRLSELTFKEATFRASVLDELNDHEVDEPPDDPTG